MKKHSWVLVAAVFTGAILLGGPSLCSASDPPNKPPVESTPFSGATPFSGSWSKSSSDSEGGTSRSESLSVSESADAGPGFVDITVEEMANGITHTRRQNGVPYKDGKTVLARLIAEAKKGLPSEPGADGSSQTPSLTKETINWSESDMHETALTANRALVFSGAAPGAVLRLGLTQDGGGSRSVTWPASVRWPGGVAPTLTAAAGKTDWFEFLYNGTNYFGITLGQGY
ncbi:MAG: hypothetical protein JO250_08870 [Armatimonadetes bacterium]|nr:hypothetical protein [Armatimonadota bacterium]